MPLYLLWSWTPLYLLWSWKVCMHVCKGMSLTISGWRNRLSGYSGWAASWRENSANSFRKHLHNVCIQVTQVHTLDSGFSVRVKVCFYGFCDDQCCLLGRVLENPCADGRKSNGSVSCFCGSPHAFHDGLMKTILFSTVTTSKHWSNGMDDSFAGKLTSTRHQDVSFWKLVSPGLQGLVAFILNSLSTYDQGKCLLILQIQIHITYNPKMWLIFQSYSL